MRQLYLLLGLIGILLVVMTALVPDYREDGSGAMELEPLVSQGEQGPGEQGETGSGPRPAEGETGSESGRAEAENGEPDPGDVIGDESVQPEVGQPEPGGETLQDHSTGDAVHGEPSGESMDEPDSADEQQRARPEPGSRGRLYFVLDDVGYSVDELMPFLDTGIPMTISVLPHLEHSTETARLAREAGQDVILHMPMEPVVDANPGPGAILTGHTESEIRTLIDEALESVPGAIGANNHMGSAVTADRQAMRAVMDEFYRRDLFFLDSLTNAATAVPAVAAEIAVPYLRRHVFVDHERDEASMREALDRGIQHAEEEGAAVLIGHAQTETLPPLLEEAYERALELGVSFEGLSHLRDTAYLVDARQ